MAPMTAREMAIFRCFHVSVPPLPTALVGTNGAWCAYYNDGGSGDPHCRFATLEQCLADVRGIGGNCGPSPYPSSPGSHPLTRLPRR
jgi:hypothetical protein